MEYTDFEEAIAIHNDVPQGLSSTIFTNLLARRKLYFGRSDRTVESPTSISAQVAPRSGGPSAVKRRQAVAANLVPTPGRHTCAARPTPSTRQHLAAGARRDVRHRFDSSPSPRSRGEGARRADEGQPGLPNLRPLATAVHIFPTTAPIDRRGVHNRAPLRVGIATSSDAPMLVPVALVSPAVTPRPVAAASISRTVRWRRTDLRRSSVPSPRSARARSPSSSPDRTTPPRCVETPAAHRPPTLHVAPETDRKPC